MNKLEERHKCPTCGAPAKMTWSGLDLVAESGDETLASKHYIHLTKEEVAIGFLEWINENRYSKYWGSDEPNCGKWYIQYTPAGRKYYSSDELFEMYLNTIK